MNKNLEKTIPMMKSDCYKERFRAEFYQLYTRAEALANMIHSWDEGTLDFEPKTDRFLLNLQLKSMQDYLSILAERSEIEDIDISLKAE